MFSAWLYDHQQTSIIRSIEIMAESQNPNQNVSSEELSPTSNNVVVRIDQDSASDLQALFDNALNPDSNRHMQVPLRLRNLPSSFFNPSFNGSKSLSASHTRDNSVDSAFDGGSLAVNRHQGIHLRAHSSPASLQQTYQIDQQQNFTIHHHDKQRSYDSIIPINDLLPLPPGWEQARTTEGQTYYLNHFSCTTTWEDPRKSEQINQQLLSLNPQDAIQNHEQKITTITQLQTLPYGWEQTSTEEGEMYFINHQTRTTSWFDPRIPVHLQRSPENCILPMLSAISSQEQVTEQKIRLEMLQIERDRLKQRQEEISREQGIMMQMNTTMLDPYLTDLTEHSRQESADSGLGLGTANSYPITNSPIDYLANISNVIDNMGCSRKITNEELSKDDEQSSISRSPTPPEIPPKSNDLTWL